MHITGLKYANDVLNMQICVYVNLYPFEFIETRYKPQMFN